MRSPATILAHVVTALTAVLCLAFGAFESDSAGDWLALAASTVAGCLLILALLRQGERGAGALLRPSWVAAGAMLLALVFDLPGPVDQLVFGLGAGAGLGLLAALALPGRARATV